jgi:hypothetical protein
MKTEIEIDISFSADEGSDLFLFIKSNFNQNELDYTGLTFEQILESSEDLLTEVGEGETITFKEKIETSMNKFLQSLDGIIAKKVITGIIDKIEKSDLEKTDKIRACDYLQRILQEKGLYELREFMPVYRSNDGNHRYSDLSELFDWDRTTFATEDFWKKIHFAISK